MSFYVKIPPDDGGGAGAAVVLTVSDIRDV
jgi:hypothetical protein